MTIMLDDRCVQHLVAAVVIQAVRDWRTAQRTGDTMKMYKIRRELDTSYFSEMLAVLGVDEENFWKHLARDQYIESDLDSVRYIYSASNA